MGRDLTSDRNRSTKVLTAAILPATAQAVWDRLMFFEQVPGPPPLLLSLLLPKPLRVEGRRSRIGDETRCVYSQGHLVKRVTAVIAARQLTFEVIEQRLGMRGGIRLEGGSYRLTPVPKGTRVEVETRYGAPRSWGAFRKPLEALVAHAFHRHLIDALWRELAPRRFTLRAREFEELKHSGSSW